LYKHNVIIFTLTVILSLKTYTLFIFLGYVRWSGFGSVGVACWPLVPKFAGFKDEKILSAPSFGGEVKPSDPCRKFAACKRSLNGVEVVI